MAELQPPPRSRHKAWQLTGHKGDTLARSPSDVDLPWGGWEGGQQRLSFSLLLYKKVVGAGGGAAVNALLKDRPPAAAASQPGPSTMPYTPASPSPL